ncbi:Zinc finger C2H2-type [Arabidopsis thaliana x Arabidopsis arenosa]|uniref:Zinc finger C2H2-type n=1 Tax=Arabidopsis thaliana x Arabidopsis arenosa TaxID=1240361 RepID=A0A8T2BIG2_9BRAS|nr:Zinc finger C2H2-type [Arabidopsis thaliana x Arabidopsis arenosa]
MALLTFLPENAEAPQKHKPPSSKRKKRENPTDQTQPRKHKPQKPKKEVPQKQPSSWDQIKNLLTCKQIEGSRVHDPSKNSQVGPSTTTHLSPSKLGSSCSSICSFRDVAHGNTRVVHRADHSPDVANSAAPNSETRLLTRKPGQHGSSSSRSLTSGSTRSNASGSYTSSSTTSFRAMQFRKLSGCYECHMIVDPSRYPISPRVCACSQCGEVFPKLESLELHQAVRHAVSELGPEDSGRNIVEIIFKSSWLKKDSPICQIERILKVQNTQRTIQRFEDCRDAVKARALQATRKDARCAADGNELLRFHCTTLTCSLGARGSSSLCSNLPGCGVCTVIRHGFQGKSGGGGAVTANAGVRTTASSGRADDLLRCSDDARRVMLVCRVIAGRVKRVDLPAAEAPAPAEKKSSVEDNSVVGVSSSGGTFDSVAVNAGVYSNLEELVVYNPRAILPCFVVIYKVLES